MTPPPQTPLPAASETPPATTVPATEKLQTALAESSSVADSFETAIRETVDAVGGVLLFKLRLGADDTARWVAAVAFGEADAQDIAIVDVPCQGGEASVTSAAESTLPIASIAAAYAGLAQTWKAAA